MSRWEKVKLSKLCLKIGDGLHGTPTYTNDSDIYFINGNNLNDGIVIIDADTKRITDKELERNFIELGDNTLLLSINGTLGSMAFYNGEKVMLGKSVAYLNFKTRINRFYYYYFQLKSIQKYFYDVATGSTIKNLSLKSLQDFEVPLPKEKEWKGIAAVLSALDDKIELNNRINAELEAMAKTIYDYWFVQFEFPAEASAKVGNKSIAGKPYKSSGGKMVYNETLKRAVPEGWEVKSLGDLCFINPSQISGNTNWEFYNYLDTSNLTRNVIDEAVRIDNKEDLPSRARRIVKENDIVYSTVRPNQEHYGILKVPMDNLVVSTGFTVLSPKNNGGLNDVLYYFISAKETTAYLQNIAQNSVSSYPSINPDDLASMNISLPKDRAILKPVIQLLCSVNKQIHLNQGQNQELSRLRDWLLPMLMNGQVTVAQAYEQVAEVLGVAAEEEGKSF